jgi:3-hydroxyacyl-[acyl-carrier-protein] dehydratase
MKLFLMDTTLILHSLWPGILIVEALAQVSAVVMLTKEQGRLGLLAGIDKCCFKQQVIPGDKHQLEVEITRLKGPIERKRYRCC